MDLVIVPSEHSKQGFLTSKYDKLQQTPDGKQQKVGELKLEKPIEVLFEGADEDIYKPLNNNEIDSDFFDMLNEKVPEKFAIENFPEFDPSSGYTDNPYMVSYVNYIPFIKFGGNK